MKKPLPKVSKTTVVNVYHNSTTPQAIALPPATPPTKTAPKASVGPAQPDRTAAARDPHPAFREALACARVLHKGGSPLTKLEIVRMGRHNLAGLVNLAKSTAAWSNISDTDRLAIENALLPKAARPIETLADLKATLRPHELRRLSVEDRMEIFAGTDFLKTATASATFQRLPAESQSTIKAHVAKFGQPSATPSAPTNTLAITTPSTAPSKSTVTPGEFRAMTGIDQHLFKQAGGIVEAPQMSRTSFTKTTPAEQMKFIKSGGQLTE